MNSLEWLKDVIINIELIINILFFTGTARVNYCPKNKNETIQASEKLKCGVDEYGNNQYLCLPHVNKTSLVEFCFDGIMGIQEKGKLCLNKYSLNLKI